MKRILKNRDARLLLELALLLVLAFVAAPAEGKRKMLLGTPGIVPAAVSTTSVFRGNDRNVFTVTATADGDTVTASIAHGMGVNATAIMTPILQAPAALSLWAVTTLDVTNIVLTKATTASSGNASPQIRVEVQRNRG